MKKDFDEFLESYGPTLEKKGIKIEFAKLVFFEGYNKGYDAARITALDAISRNKKT